MKKSDTINSSPEQWFKIPLPSKSNVKIGRTKEVESNGLVNHEVSKGMSNFNFVINMIY